MSKQDPATSACQERTLQSAVLPESLRLKVKKSYIYIYQLQVTIIGIGSLTLLNHRSITLLRLLSSGKSFKTPKKNLHLECFSSGAPTVSKQDPATSACQERTLESAVLPESLRLKVKKELQTTLRHRQPRSSQAPDH